LYCTVATTTIPKHISMKITVCSQRFSTNKKYAHLIKWHFHFVEQNPKLIKCDNDKTFGGQCI